MPSLGKGILNRHQACIDLCPQYVFHSLCGDVLTCECQTRHTLLLSLCKPDELTGNLSVDATGQYIVEEWHR